MSPALAPPTGWTGPQPHPLAVPHVLTEYWTKHFKEVFLRMGIIWRYRIIKCWVNAIECSATLLVGQYVIG